MLFKVFPVVFFVLLMLLGALWQCFSQDAALFRELLAVPFSDSKELCGAAVALAQLRCAESLGPLAERFEEAKLEELSGTEVSSGWVRNA